MGKKYVKLRNEHATQYLQLNEEKSSSLTFLGRNESDRRSLIANY